MQRLTWFLAVLSLVLLPSVASAQFQYGPGGTIVGTTDVVNASGQVATAQSLIPAAMQTVYTSMCQQTICKLSASGVLGTAPAAAGTLTFGFSYGGLTPTITARTLETQNVNTPWWIEVTISPNASVAATTGKSIDFKFFYVPTGTTVVMIGAAIAGNTTFTATQAMVLTATFSDITIGTGMITRRAIFGAGS